RAIKEANVIRISFDEIARVDDSAKKRAALEKQGIYVLETEKQRTIAIKDGVGSHRIETTITLYPPVGHGEGGASSFADLKIVLDGTTRVNCPIWNGYIGLERISLDLEEGFVFLLAHEHSIRFDGFESQNVVDLDWLENRSKSFQQVILGKP